MLSFAIAININIIAASSSAVAAFITFIEELNFITKFIIIIIDFIKLIVIMEWVIRNEVVVIIVVELN